MLYPIHVHKEEGSAYGASFPDFPGCFAAADELQDLPRAVQEAVEAHFHGETEAIPGPSAPEAWAGQENFEGGFWMLVDIDLSKVSSKAIRLNISLPESLVHRIDAMAKEDNLPRSALLATAAKYHLTGAILKGKNLRLVDSFFIKILDSYKNDHIQLEDAVLKIGHITQAIDSRNETELKNCLNLLKNQS